MLKIVDVKKITQDAIKIKNYNEEKAKKKQEEKEFQNLCKEIESNILDAAKRGETFCSIRMDSEKYFDLIKEKYSDFHSTLLKDEDGEPIFTFRWE